MVEHSLPLVLPERIKSHQPRRPGHLSSEYECLLRYGDTEGFYDNDGSRIIAAIEMDAVNNGCSRDGIFELLNDPRNKGGFACLRRKGGDIRRWFERDWATAEKRAASVPKLAGRNETVYMARTLRERADDMAWRGTSGASDRAVYDALLEIGEQVGKLLDVGVSGRAVDGQPRQRA